MDFHARKMPFGANIGLSPKNGAEVSYNLVLRSYAREGSYTEAEQWLLEMERKKRATVCSPLTLRNVRNF